MRKRSVPAIGVILAGLMAFAAPVQANVVVNGGFEAGDFSGWSETGDTAFNGVQCPGPGPGVHAGDCSAYFGPMFAVGGIEQMLDVGGAGNQWALSFAFQPDGGSASSFTVTFGGQTLLSLSEPAFSDDFQLYHFSGVTTADHMTLSFNFFDPVGFLFLDDVSVTVIPEPAMAGLLGVGLAGLVFSRRRKTA